MKDKSYTKKNKSDSNKRNAQRWTLAMDIPNDFKQFWYNKMSRLIDFD